MKFHLREDLLGSVGPLKFKRNIRKRIEIVVQAIRDGCNDCPFNGIVCSKHLAVIQRLTLDPRRELPKLEAEIFGERG